MPSSDDPRSAAPVPEDGRPVPSNLELLSLFRQCAHAQRPPQVSHGKNRLLINLAERGPMTQRALGEVTRRTPATLAQQLAALEEEGLVERRRCQGDRRNVDVRLTDAGLAAARTASEERQRRADELFGGLGEDDRRAFARILRDLLARWGNRDASAPATAGSDLAGAR